MISKLLIAWCLMAICVMIHAMAITAAFQRLQYMTGLSRTFWVWTRGFVVLAGWIVFVHVFEIAVWAVMYAWKDAMPDLQSALYFSAVTYTTTGYGDLVLPAEWRLLGAVEALTGILMCGWSTGFFFAVLNRMFEARTRNLDPLA
jgi:voltage-gated potassium channel Kch